MSDINLYLGDCLYRMAEMDANSIDTIITDPPYGLSFMGKDWDHGVPGVPFWTEALRVAKPGAMLLAFGGTRTFHRLTCAIEDAGWEIRDCLMWLYGSGFPKSHDISKAIDRMAGAEREVIGHTVSVQFREQGRNPHYTVHSDNSGYGTSGQFGHGVPITAPATDSAKLWEGWGTALKPAWEPIVLAMKPVSKTFAENALEYGVAGLNIDGGRILTGERPHRTKLGDLPSNGIYGEGLNGSKATGVTGLGRWPANLLLDQESARQLDKQSGELGNAWRPHRDRDKRVTPGIFGGDKLGATYPDRGGASRFFYCAKASRAERNFGLEGDRVFMGSGGRTFRNGEWVETHSEPQKRANHHPTVKPLALMRYLCRLTQTPTGGIVLDPFMGSGTTGVACVQTGRNFIGVEIDPGYFEIAQKRIEQAQELKNNEQSNN